MSLFNTLDFWSTHCGENENFGFDSMVLADLDESGNDYIIIGGFSGLLRIYQVNNTDTDRSFKPSHLMIEKRLPNPIIQVFVGMLVSGTRALHIGVVQPTHISVYNFISTPGSTDHGYQYDLKLMYDHPVQHTNFQVVHGPFGGVKGRDFLCAVSLDGMLTFFEQETFVFRTQLPSFLLPSPIVYVEETDMFVTCSADWCIEAYRYQDLVNTAKKKVIASWVYNLGENIQSIRVVKHHLQKETLVLALSEHNLICFGASGNAKFTKRLQYSPICFHCYLNESNNELMTLITSDGGVLYVYECKKLVWSAKLPYVPICVTRGNASVNGSLVLLSESGDLQCCYLGTKPSLFVAPPLENSIISFKNMNARLERLQDEIKNFKNSNADILTSTTIEHELSLKIKMQFSAKASSEAQVLIDLVPSRPLTNIHVTFQVPAPFDVHPRTYTFPSLCENMEAGALIHPTNQKEIVPSSLEFNVIVCYSNNGVVRVMRRSKTIRPTFILTPSSVSEDKCQFRISIESNKTPPPLTTIFQEFRDERWLESSCNDESVGLCLRYNSDVRCLITLAKSKFGYDLTANSLPLIRLVLSMITWKCKNMKNTSENSTEKLSFSCKTLPRNELMECIHRRVSTKNEIHELQLHLEKLSAQSRLIQRRLLIKLKEKTFSNVTAVQTLYQNTYEKLTTTIRAIEQKQKSLILYSCELQSVLDLIFSLIAMSNSANQEKIDKLQNAVHFTDLDSDAQDWETSTVANITHLLQTTLASSDSDQHRIIPSTDEIITDESVVKNLITTAFERISDRFTNEEKSEKNRSVVPILEDDEFDEGASQNDQPEKSEMDKFLLKHQLFKMTQDSLDEAPEELFNL